MYGPSKGDMNFLFGMAIVGLVALVVVAVLALSWIVNHVSVSL